MRRWAIWALNTALFVAGCYLAARIVLAILAEVVLPTRSEVTQVAATGPVRTRSWSDNQIIVERNLFGAKTIGEQGEVPIADIQAVETKLPLALLGTVAGDNEKVSSAAIQDLGTRTHQVVFVGDMIESQSGVRVVRIQRGVVLLDNKGKREKLELDEGNAPKRPKRVARAGRRARPKRDRQRTRLAERVEQMQADPTGRSTASLYSQARIIPKWEDGAMVGVQLNQIKPGSLYEKLGIKDGDVITSLNGIAIDSPQASSRLLTELTQAQEFDIEFSGRDPLQVGEEQLEGLLAENEEG